MFPANAFMIRIATERDDAALRRLAAIDCQPAFDGPALVGVIGGEIAAAISLADDRVISDPFTATGQLYAHLRMRAAGLRAYVATPAVAERIRGALPPAAVARPIAA